MRRLPHRPARCRRRAPASEIADRAGTRDCRSCRSFRIGRKRSHSRRQGRGSVARRSLWRLCLLPFGPREPVRHAEFHRLYPRRRLRHAYAGERRLLLRTQRQRRRRGNSTAPVCRPDRLAQLSHGGGGESSRTLRIRRRRSHSGPGRRLARKRRLRLHPARRHRLAGFCPPAWRRLGGRL